MATSTSPQAVGSATRTSLERLVEQLHHQEESVASAESRHETRRAVHAPVMLGVILHNHQTFKPLYRAWATDLSRLGVGLLIENDMPQGMELVVNLEPLLGRECLVPVRVVYCRRLLPHTYRLGLLFIWGD